MTEYLSPADVDARRDDLQILDVREHDEWQAGRIEGAVHIPLNDLLNGKTDGLDPSKPVVAYCRTANRSEVARLMLRAQGFEAYTMEGGGVQWEAEGRPLPTPTGDPGRCA
jgi:rhodanese-related sulfurtransferase